MERSCWFFLKVNYIYYKRNYNRGINYTKNERIVTLFQLTPDLILNRTISNIKIIINLLSLMCFNLSILCEIYIVVLELYSKDLF